MLTISACGGSDVLSGLRSTFLDGVGKHGRGAGAGAQDEDFQAVDILLSGCIGSGLGLIGDRLAVGGGSGRLDGSGRLLDSGRRGAGGDGGSTIGLKTQLGGALGLLVAEQLIVCLQERQVDDGVQQYDDCDKHQGDKLEVRGDEDADGGRGSPRHHEGEAVHAHVIDKELGNAYVDAAGGNKGDEHVGVKDHRRAKEQRFVDGEGNRNNRGLTDGFELLGLHKENQQKRHDERGAGAAELTHERHVEGEGMGGVTTGQQNLQVLGLVGKTDGVDARLDDRGAVDADEPEERGGCLDKDKARIGFCSGKERGEQFDKQLGERNAHEVAHDDIDDAADDDGAAKGDDVTEVLSDGARDLLGQLNGQIARDAEFVDPHGDERGDIGREQTARAHAGAVEDRKLGAVELGGELRNGEQKHAALGGHHGGAVVEHLAGGHATVHGSRKVLGSGAGNHDAHDAHGEVVQLVAPVDERLGQRDANYAGKGGDQQEDRRGEDDGHAPKESVLDGLEVDVPRDLLKERLMLFEHLYDGVHRAPLLLDARCMWMELVVDGWSGLPGNLPA